MLIAILVGTRPEIIKLSPVIRELNNRSIDFFILHTNQHYDHQMDHIFFKQLKLPLPKYNLNIGSGSHGEQTGKMIIGIEKILKQEKPNYIIVQGDTNTVVAGALAAAKELAIKISHVEAGLRSYDRTMPEEINRIIADHISDYLFAPTIIEKKILCREGISTKKIFVVGNTIVDAVKQNLKVAKIKNNILKSIKLVEKKYLLLTLHRPSNVDQRQTLINIFKGLDQFNRKMDFPIVFPCHPRTKKQINKYHIKLNKNYQLLKPVGYLDMLLLIKQAKLIFTDSGGIQEEACILRVPCVTLRYNTERPETLKVGGNILAGNKSQRICTAAKKIINKKINWFNPFGDGNTAKKIVNILCHYE